MDDSLPEDPYVACLQGHCHHDLARAVTVSELWGTDGPFVAGQVVVDLGSRRVVLLDEEQAPARQQRWAV